MLFYSNVQIGQNTFIGTNATVIPGIKIGNNVTVGAGSVVIQDIKDNMSYVGKPSNTIEEMKPVLIIAEAGVNHNGDLNIAKQLIDAAAAEACADVVKFQTYKTENIVSKEAKQAAYQNKNIDTESDTQYEMLKKLELPIFWHTELHKYAKDKGLIFLSTGFDLESLDFFATLSPPFFKIPSGEITNKPLLIHIAKFQKPIILSTGMSTIEEIKDAIAILNENGISNKNIQVLHCNTAYLPH